MMIENPDAFKSWLTSVLEPLCDADPEALAKYVFALVKKDKSVDTLRQSMVEQLDVFLQSETKPFVELLFKTIESQDYLMIPNTNPPNPNPTPIKKEADSLIVKDIKPIIPVSTLPNLSESINGNVTVKKPPADETASQTVSTTTGTTGGTVSKKDEPRRRRNRSRSRSWEPRGAKRSRSRERSPRRSRPWRNKSPPARRGGWRRSRSGSPATRIRSRSRSPRHGGHRGPTRYRNRSPPRSPTRSRSRDKDKKEKDKEENSGGATPTQDSNHGDTDMRLTSTTQSIQSVVSAAAAAVGPAVPGGPTELYKRRCRDFDEKGYCMRGEMCPYDHGVDPVVLEDTALTRVLTFGPNGAPLEPQHPLQGAHHPPQRPIMEYNPSAPGMWHHRAGFRPRVMAVGPRGAVLPPGAMPPGGPPFVPLPSMQRELINVPVTDMQQGGPPGGPHGFKRRAPLNHDFSQDSSTPPKRKQGNFDFNRLGPRAPGPKNPSNCSLELKKVPRGLNNITHLNNHFSKFGKIINIQVNFEGDHEGALVTFSSHAEANAAYRSTEAVLNNRFIKVFWHSAPGGAERQENVPPVPQNAVAARPVKDRLGQPANSNKVLNLVQPKAAAVAETGDDEGAPQGAAKSVYVPSRAPDSRALAQAAIVKGQEILAAKEQLKKKHEEKRKEALKITQDLRKRKQELLEKQLAQQKLLIEKLEKTNPTGGQRDLLMTTIKTVQESIESIRKDMVNSAPPAGAPPRKSKEEAQREVLDAELDLITRQAEGGDTSELQRRLAELRAQAQSLAPAGTPRRGRGPPNAPRHRHPARGSLVLDRTKGGPPGGKVQHVVDHRPTRVLVSGYESDESDSVLAFFAQFGEISEYITDNSTPSVILKYKTRKEAEVALLKGRNFQDRTLSVTWCSGAPRGSAPVQLVAPQPPPPETKPDEPVIEKPETEVKIEVEGQPEVKPEEKVEEKEEEGPAETAPPIPEDRWLEGDDENVLGAEYTEEALLQDDEEEEETEDDRSWRR